MTTNLNIKGEMLQLQNLPEETFNVPHVSEDWVDSIWLVAQQHGRPVILQNPNYV